MHNIVVCQGGKDNFKLKTANFIEADQAGGFWLWALGFGGIRNEDWGIYV